MDDPILDDGLPADRRTAGTTVIGGRVTGSRVALGGSLEPGRPRRRVPVVRIAMVLTVVALGALALARPAPAPTTPPAARSTADPFATPVMLGWSPDGRRLAYILQTRAPLPSVQPASPAGSPAE